MGNFKANENQRLVINELEKNILLLASAGTGKTNTLAHRIANIINLKKALPSEILCLTFTNKACKEISKRVVSVVGSEALSVKIKTFHSFCFEIIKMESKYNTDISKDFVIFDEEDCKEIINEIVSMDFKKKLSKKIPYAFISFIKNEHLIRDVDDINIIIKEFFSNRNDDRLNKIFQDEDYKTDYCMIEYFKKNGQVVLEKYKKFMLENHALDFMDLILNAKSLLQNEDIQKRWQKKYKYILIDEVQDTNLSEYKLISKLFKDNNIMMCGDYFQTIYEWRGSTPEEIFESYKTMYNPDVVILNKNYRATKCLCELSHKYLKTTFKSKTNAYYDDKFEIDSECEGEKSVLKYTNTINEEAEWIYNKIKSLDIEKFSNIAILTRANNVNVALSKKFFEKNNKLPQEQQIPFLLIDDFKFFRRKEIKDIIAYLNIINNKYDCNSFKRILERFAKGIGNKTIEDIENSEARNIGVRLTDFSDPTIYSDFEPFQLLLNNLENNNVVIFDVESTGLNTTNDEIVQIAAIKINSLGEEIERFTKFLKPSKFVGDSVNIHKFTDEYLNKYGENAKDVLNEFLTFIQGSVLVGHNVKFDLDICTSQMNRLELEKLEYIWYYDTLDMTRRFYPKMKNYMLETLSKEFDVKVSSNHNAINDILATKDILIKIINEKIKPSILNRIVFYEKYLEKFADINKDINYLRQQSLILRPHELVKEVIETSGIKNIYLNEPERINNIEYFYELTKEMDDDKLSSQDSLIELLKLVSLSNSELDILLEKNPKIPLITVHQAKGSEYDYVFLAGLNENIFPSYPAIKEGRDEEEQRLFYVALTRAKKQMFLSSSKCNLKGVYRGHSKFLDNLEHKEITVE